MVFIGWAAKMWVMVHWRSLRSLPPAPFPAKTSQLHRYMWEVSDDDTQWFFFYIPFLFHGSFSSEMGKRKTSNMWLGYHLCRNFLFIFPRLWQEKFYICSSLEKNTILSEKNLIYFKFLHSRELRKLFWFPHFMKRAFL